ncbi:M1 family metallopeptidase [Roseivirga sp. BDSF3-8]|uniref:M1 family metallopeptidase n=1 Tax=Roseivirga sp. BDSF3-8 TaxID=3241598 RepID=UPI0035325B5A
MHKTFLTALALAMSTFASMAAGDSYWQQRAEYNIDVSLDVNTNRYEGSEKIEYYNNSPDTLFNVYFHLYPNAFKPGSMMDVRSRNLPDPDRRVQDRIYNLEEDEYGYLNVTSLSMNGKKLTSEVSGTVLEVTLTKPILPGKKATFSLDFAGQVPKQIRRSGRDNSEGIRYSMTQWFPKMAEYDYQGWHPDPYVAREFHGVWGDFDVKITLDSEYVVAASGYLQNPDEVGHGYAEGEVKRRGKELTWHFKAPDVHDFAWAADPDYTHEVVQVPDGPEVHFFYQPENDTITQNWKVLQGAVTQTFQIMNKEFGKYPWDKYSVIQGGDGGMEYAMATLITGERQIQSLVNVAVHEIAHSWYQMALATNEAKYPWMDEGFTSFAEDVVMDQLLTGSRNNPHAGAYRSYFNIVGTDEEEPLSTPSDYYSTNRGYGTNAYSKGNVFLHQLSYVIGKDTFDEAFKKYFNTYKLKHPTPDDFIRLMEKESGMVLDWYLEHWLSTTNSIDYGISDVNEAGNKTEVVLERIGKMPMPIDVVVTYTDGSKELFYMPLQIMRGEKNETMGLKRTTLEDWPWVYPYYSISINKPKSQIESIEIDPTERLADINKENNLWTGDNNASTYQQQGTER